MLSRLLINVNITHLLASIYVSAAGMLSRLIVILNIDFVTKEVVLTNVSYWSRCGDLGYKE